MLISLVTVAKKEQKKKKTVDKCRSVWYDIEVVTQDGCRKHEIKKLKNLKKCLTNPKRCDILI